METNKTIKILLGLILVISLFACKRSINNNGTPTATISSSTMEVQATLDLTRDYFALQTIVAGEQLTKTPTSVVVPPAQWTELFTKSPTNPGGIILSPTPMATRTPNPMITLTPGSVLIPTLIPTNTAPPPKPTKPAPTEIPTTIPPTSVPPTPAPTEPLS